ncbi:bifunctional diaminohydroxyphosphoribosylaminopyrimidine deaminase/5-amino-6-(5-phosphoribosylamino)uracil reductase RibD [Schlesneria paludicola]|uniref:bifunctional diaminohydroxyphosphoribosylaminopyrimidine deaminase/5-amino-6-(5-phosphoribosylamino)uracil reductase RibD n=1 Tax=Schlesneria paludicola TaxID=360056 RepID=UPI00029B4D80|nr:bifunctional diaminohydroxyphosphoribosylaminopyrimidine deaminase/5-amino-6-(5-phosphoribosylamino)uracil reductase RibD [Schlesneria paludicola]
MTDPLPFAQETMRRALMLAERGRGAVEPNPVVGAIVVNDFGQILGEGWHQKHGGPHAEVHALKAAGEAARGATLFVTLEPCCHFGKTPPCSRAVIAAGIKRVIVAMPDPAPHVDGGGIRELRAAGIDVEVGLLEADARRMVAPFVQLITQQRPWFHAKWAMTLDGKIATGTGHSQWITNAASRAIVHQLRGRMDAIMIGIGTALADDPQLTARPSGPRVALRIVIDSRVRLPLTSKLVQTAREIPVLVIATADAPHERIAALQSLGVETCIVGVDAAGHASLVDVADELGRRRLTNVLVEGGGQLLGGLFDLGYINEAHAFIAPKLIGGADSPTPIGGRGLAMVPTEASLESPEIELIEGDLYVHGPVRRQA